MEKYINVALVGDYNFSLTAHIASNLAIKDAEKSMENTDVNSFWLSSKEIEEDPSKQLSKYDGFIICPGPYKSPLAVMKVIKYARENNFPLLATCSGFKLGVLEYIENNLQLDSTFKGKNIVVDRDVLPQYQEGYFPVEIFLNKGTKAESFYLKDKPVEQSRSNWCVDEAVIKLIQEKGFKVAARNSELDAEVLELNDHPYFILCKYSPQFTTSEFYPHPLLVHFLLETEKELDKKQEIITSN